MSKVISILYIILCIGLPILYLISYKKRHPRKPKWGQALGTAFVIFFVLISVKLIVYFLEVDKLNCYLNNVCDAITTTTSTSTTTTTTTTTKKIYKYPALDIIAGNKEKVGKTSKGYDIIKVNDIYFIDNILIANKTYPLSSKYDSMDPYKEPNGAQKCNECINNIAYSAWLDMQSAAKDDNINIRIVSGYRSYDYQDYLYNYYVSTLGQTGADLTSARPGHSEHQTGLAFDINMSTSPFNNTKEAKWLNDNAYKFGYILRYPANKEEITGYEYESWHYRYVGEELSYKLYNNGDWITLEEYFGITSKYQN